MDLYFLLVWIVASGCQELKDLTFFMNKIFYDPILVLHLVGLAVYVLQMGAAQKSHYSAVKY